MAGSIFLDSRCDNTFHDARIWRVTVSVSYDDNGRLTAVPTIRENESAPKADGIVFNNSYDPTFTVSAIRAISPTIMRPIM